MPSGKTGMNKISILEQRSRLKISSTQDGGESGKTACSPQESGRPDSSQTCRAYVCDVGGVKAGESAGDGEGASEEKRTCTGRGPNDGHGYRLSYYVSIPHMLLGGCSLLHMLHITLLDVLGMPQVLLHTTSS